MRNLVYKSKNVLAIEERFNTSIEALLHRLYIVDMKSAEEIGVSLGTSHVTINKYLIRMGIKRRFDWKELVDRCIERKTEQ